MGIKSIIAIFYSVFEGITNNYQFGLCQLSAKLTDFPAWIIHFSGENARKWQTVGKVLLGEILVRRELTPTIRMTHSLGGG